MIIRKANLNEFERIDELFAVSFGTKTESSASQPTNGDDVRYAAFEDDIVVSAIYVPSYSMSFDGQDVKMAGIGGVSTLPEYRKNGAIRGIFTKLLPDLYDEGFDFSYLYPFSTAYYRKFGYENGCDLIKYTIHTEALPDKSKGAKVFLLDDSTRKDAKDLIIKVYDSNRRKYNGLTAADDDLFSWIDKENPYREATYTYVYGNTEAESAGYVSYRLCRDEKGLFIDVYRLMVTDSEALVNLLGILKTYGSDYSRTVLTIPMHTELENLISEWSFGYLKREIIPHGMVRVINVKAVLMKAAYKGSGCFTVEINDSYIAENTCRYTVTYKNGRAVSVEENTEGKADFTLTIEKFSAMIFGKCDVFDADNVFYPKRINIITEF